MIKHLGKYSLAALSSEVIANYRDTCLGSLTNRGQPTSNNTVRLELALLSHLFTVAIQEWGLELIFNAVLNIRKPSPGEGRNRRLMADEEKRLMASVGKHSNPMLGWIAQIALATGMRASEIAGLRRSQVDVQKRIVRLSDTKNDSARTVPLTTLATELFRAALAIPCGQLTATYFFR